jgi:hypothetical protein
LTACCSSHCGLLRQTLLDGPVSPRLDTFVRDFVALRITMPA